MNRNNEFNREKEKNFLSNAELSAMLMNEFFPIALTTTVLAPINRLKICLQTMSMISISSSEKTYSSRNLAISIVYDI